MTDHRIARSPLTGADRAITTVAEATAHVGIEMMVGFALASYAFALAGDLAREIALPEDIIDRITSLVHGAVRFGNPTVGLHPALLRGSDYSSECVELIDLWILHQFRF